MDKELEELPEEQPSDSNLRVAEGNLWNVELRCPADNKYEYVFVSAPTPSLAEAIVLSERPTSSIFMIRRVGEVWFVE